MSGGDLRAHSLIPRSAGTSDGHRGIVLLAAWTVPPGGGVGGHECGGQAENERLHHGHKKEHPHLC